MAQEAPVIYSGLSDPNHAPGTLFQSWDIFLSQRVPQRSLYVQKIQQNGGRVVPLEKNARIIIVDHLRRDPPPDSFSYTWIDACISQAKTVEQSDHRVSLSMREQPARQVGASSTTKSHRNPFTPEDDRILYNWVKECEKQGSKANGNEIYKQLGIENSRHPWQSWRDRYIKYVCQRPPPTSVSQETPPTPPSDNDPGRSTSHAPESTSREREAESAASAPRARKFDQEATAEQHPTAPNSKRENQITESQNGGQTSGEIGETPRSLPKDTNVDSGRIATITPRQGQAFATPYSASNKAKSFSSFSEEDHAILLDNARDIQRIEVGVYDDFWNEVAPEKWGEHHSASEWREYYENVVLPEWKQSGTGKVNGNERERSPERPPSSSASEVFRARISQISPRRQGAQSPGKRKRDEDIDEHGRSERFGEPAQQAAIDGIITNWHETSKQSPSRIIQVPTSTNELWPSNQPEDIADFSPPAVTPRSRAKKAYSNRKKEVSFVNLVGSDENDSSAENQDTDPQQPGQTNFGIYEDYDIPDDDKENVVCDESGSFSIPPRHRHVRSEEALDAFSDPLPKFTLEGNSGNIEVDVLSEIAPEDAAPTAENAQNLRHESVPEIPEEEDGILGNTADHAASHDSQQPIENNIRNEEGGFTDNARHFTQGSPTQRTGSSRVQFAEDETVFFADDSQDGSRMMVEEQEIDSEDEEDDYYENMRRDEANEVETFEEFPVDFLTVPPPDSDVPDDVDRHSPQPDVARPNVLDQDTQHILESETQIPDLDVPPPPSSLPDIPSSPPQLPSSHPTISTITIRKEVAEQYSQQDDSPITPRAQRSPTDPPRAAAPRPASDRPPGTNTTRLAPASNLPNPPPPTADDDDNNDDFDNPDDRAFIAEQAARGHNSTEVLYALQRASADHKLALRVLGMRRKGRRDLPEAVRGIWTHAHDEDLQRGDARKIRALEELHGKDALKRRVALLNEWARIDE